MNGAGNDFVMLDNLAGEIQLSREQISRICDRHRGVGADGILVLEKAANGADFRMRYYNRDGGAVVISGSVEDRTPDQWRPVFALITVTDNGTGIPPGEAERVFERFYRVDRSRARQTGGSGLGLAICREVMKVLGGSIRITTSSAEGTTFEIRVPGYQASDRCFSQALASRSL